jgi:hypothetical protein
MNEHLTDRMPDVAHGRGSWTPTEERHLATCDDCRAEWRLVSAIAPQGSPVDVDRVTAGVLAALAAKPRVLPFRRRPWVPVALAAAASVALAVTLWGPAGNGDNDAATPGAFATILPELEGLLESELEQVLVLVEPTQDYAPIGEVPRLGDLTDDELELLLTQVEG